MGINSIQGGTKGVIVPGCILVQDFRVETSGGATLGPKGALAPLKYLKKLVYIYIYIQSRVILIKKCYIYNIFTINLK